jgi:hypothetical protein
VTIRTDMDHADLIALVAGQLERAGWSGRDAGLDGALAWSTWSFADGTGESCVGILYVLRCPERPGQYRLSLVAEWAGRAVQAVPRGRVGRSRRVRARGRPRALPDLEFLPFSAYAVVQTR